MKTLILYYSKQDRKHICIGSRTTPANATRLRNLLNSSETRYKNGYRMYQVEQDFVLTDEIKTLLRGTYYSEIMITKCIINKDFTKFSDIILDRQLNHGTSNCFEYNKK